MNTFNNDRAQLATLGQSEFPFMSAPSFHEARETALDLGIERLRDSVCLGTGWGFFGHDTNGLAVVVEVYHGSTTKTTACPSQTLAMWANMKAKRR